MVILGIDPGIATTGWGVIRLAESGKHKEAGDKKKMKKGSSQTADRYLNLVGFGCVLTNSKDDMGERLYILRGSLKNIIKIYRPDQMIIEKIFFGANSTSALSVGQARGVVLLVARENKVPVFEYTGLEVKLTVADHGRADKKTVQTAVRKLLRVKKLPEPKDQNGNGVFRFRDDAYDAVAAAICHVLKSYGLNPTSYIQTS